MQIICAILAFAYTWFDAQSPTYGYQYTELPTNRYYRMVGAAFTKYAGVRTEDFAFMTELAAERYEISAMRWEEFNLSQKKTPYTYVQDFSIKAAYGSSDKKATEERTYEWAYGTEILSPYGWIDSPAGMLFMCFSDDSGWHTYLYSSPSIARRTKLYDIATADDDAMTLLTEGHMFPEESYYQLTNASLYHTPMEREAIENICSYSEPLTKVTFLYDAYNGGVVMPYGQAVSILEGEDYTWDGPMDEYNLVQYKETNSVPVDGWTQWKVMQSTNMGRLKAYRVTSVTDPDTGIIHNTASERSNGYWKTYRREFTANQFEFPLANAGIYYKNGSNGAERVRSVTAYAVMQVEYETVYSDDVNRPKESDEQDWQYRTVETYNVTNICFVVPLTVSFSRVGNCVRDAGEGDGSATTNKCAFYSSSIGLADTLSDVSAVLNIEIPALQDEVPSPPSFQIGSSSWNGNTHVAPTTIRTAFREVTASLMYIFGCVDMEMNSNIPSEGDSQ